MRFVVIGILTLCAACASKTDASGRPVPSKRVREFLGPEIVPVLEHVTKTEVFRVDGPRQTASGAGDFHGYPIRARAAAPRPEFASEFVALAFDEDSYLWDLAKGCEFSPGVGLRFWNGEAHADVLLCFSCDEWEFVAGSGNAPGTPRRVEDDDPVRNALVKLAREAFPTDEALAKLPLRSKR